MAKAELVACVAYAMFVVCPRLAAMTNIISSSAGLNTVRVVSLGTVIAFPIIIAMVYTVLKWGLMAGLALCVATDLLSALLMREISLKAGLETLVIALFVVLGNRVATCLSAKL